MSLKEKINNLLLRMTNDDFEFSNEDFFLVRETEELQDILIKRILKGPVKVSNMPFDYPLGIILSRDFSHEEIQTLICNIIEMYISNDSGFDVDIVGSLGEYFSLEDSTIERIKAITEAAFAKEDYEPEYFFVNDHTLNKCLDYKNYKLISRCKESYGDSLTPTTIQRMLDEFPFKEYGLPEFFEVYYYNNYPLDKMDIEELLHLWDKTRFYTDKDYPKELTDRCIAVLIEKIKESKDLSYLNNDDKLSNFIESTDLSIRKLIRDAAYDRDYLPAYTVSFNSNKEIQDRLIRLIKENKEVPRDIFCDEVIDLNNPILMDYVIKHAIIKSLVNYGKKEFLVPYEDIIVKEIKTNPEYKKELEKLDSEDLFAFPKILQALIDNKILKEINLVNVIVDITPEMEEYVYKAVKEIPSLTVYNLNDYQVHKVDIICELIKNKNYRYVFSERNLINSLTEEEFTRVIKALDIAFEDLYEAVSFTNNNSMKDIFIAHPELFDLYFGKELLTEQILDYINHNEEFSNIYDMSAYSKLKPYFIKKYGFKEENLDLLINTVGPNVIRYIENESIKKLLTISYEELEKIINLFPNVPYTLIDLNASYDSLIQFMFGKENPEIVSIFPNFLHAIEDNDLRTIYRLKQILIINTKKDKFLSIKEKYQLTRVNDMEELLHAIVHGVRGKNSELYTNILHELTDDYILKERTNYRNNRFFYKLYPQYKELFKNLLYKIYQGEDLTEYINILTPELGKNFYKQFSSITITEELKDPSILIKYIAAKVKDPKTRVEYLPILKDIVDYCLDSIRSKKSREINIANELGVPYELDERSTDSALTNFIISHFTIFELERGSIIYDFMKVLLSKLDNLPEQVVIDSCYYIAGFKDKIKTDEATIKQTIPKVIKAVNLIKKEYTIKVKPNTIKSTELSSIIQLLDDDYQIKRNYKNLQPDIDLCDLLLNLDINIILNTILKDEELYNKLLDIMKKKKIHLLPKELRTLIVNAGISGEYTNVASFITFFKSILDSERARLSASNKNPDDALSGLAAILVNAEIYSSISSVYSQILGDEDAKLIKANPKPNDATRKTENDQRLKEAVELTKDLFTRREVTIPTFDKDVRIGNDKKLNVIVGNFTAPCNLTHGERTGACMRIGGQGDSLFYFCLKNPNGFHIRFEDPETHEYISRVSGFRNGNTVFLNELRYSCNQDKYSNEDVVEACRLVSEELIKLTANSPCPIENVVIAKQYAMEKSKLEPTDLGIDSVKKGLPKFYSDVDKKAVVLATTSEPFKKINFDKSRVPTYEPCRGKIVKTKDKKELSGMINRIVAVKQLLAGIPYEEVTRLDFPNGLLYGIVSDDWYIYVDRNKEIKFDCLNIDPRAKGELAKYTIVVEELLQNNEIVEEDEYGL